MNPTEPIELVLALAGAMTLFRSLEVFIRALARYRVLAAEGRCEAVLRLGWVKVRESGKDAMWCLVVLILGVTATLSPPPTDPQWYRPLFQVMWTLAAVWTLITELFNEYDLNKVEAIIEDERIQVGLDPHRRIVTVTSTTAEVPTR